MGVLYSRPTHQQDRARMHSSILAPVGRSDASYSLEFECYYKLKTLTMRARIEWRPGISIDAVFSARARSTRRGQFEACMVVLAPPLAPRRRPPSPRRVSKGRKGKLRSKLYTPMIRRGDWFMRVRACGGGGRGQRTRERRQMKCGAHTHTHCLRQHAARCCAAKACAHRASAAHGGGCAGRQ